MLFGVFGLASSNAQIDVTINPIGILFGDISVGADFGLSENLSVEAGVGFGSGDQLGADWSNLNFTGTGKYYFNPKHGADKFYADLFLRFTNRKYEWGDDFFGNANYKQTRFGAGFGIGYKIVSNGGFVFDINLGAGRAFVDNVKFEDDAGNQTSVDWTNLIIIGKFAVGYRFGGK